MRNRPMKSPDANVEKVVELMRSRSIVGLKKYKVTTERTDLTPLEWVRHWQAENADATIYAEKLAQEIEDLVSINSLQETLLASRNEELEELRKAVSDGGRFLLIAANRYASGAPTECRAMMSLAAIALRVKLQWPKTLPSAETDKAFVQAFNGPKKSEPGRRVSAAEWLDDFSARSVKFHTGHEAKHAKLQAAADRARERVSGYSPERRAELREQGKAAVASLAPDPSSLTPSDTRWHDAQKSPPDVSHAVIGLVNGTTKPRAVYYVAKTGKWVDVNDRPVTVTQWRHL